MRTDQANDPASPSPKRRGRTDVMRGGRNITNDMPLTLGPRTLLTVLRFTATALLVELTPGPRCGYLVIAAAHRGRSAGLTVIAGVTLYPAATVAGRAKRCRK